MRKGFFGSVIVIVLFIVLIFVLVALAAGDTVGDGILGFVNTLIDLVFGVWNTSVGGAS